jgi:hypothetical protein
VPCILYNSSQHHQTGSFYSLRNLNFSETSANNSFIFAIVSSDTCDAGPSSMRTWNLRPRPTLAFVLQVWELEMTEEAFVNGLSMFPSAREKGS